MRIINFLPDDYLQRRHLRRANQICLVLAGSAVVILGALSAVMFVRTISATAERAAIEFQCQEAGRQIDQLKQMEARKAGLLGKVELSTALLERVPRSYLLARLTNYLPAHTSLTALTMRSEAVDVKPEGKAAKPGGGKEETVKVKQVRFRIDGLAQTDIGVAEFIGRLNTDPLFEDLDLQFSEESPYAEGLTMRRFQISFRLSPKAEKILQTAVAGAPAPEKKGAS